MYVLKAWFVLLLVCLSQRCHSEMCTRIRKLFHRRPALDNTYFSDLLLASFTDIDKMTCFSKCSDYPSCRLILFNPSTNNCRLHSESMTVGTDQTGWLYHGIDCLDYRFPNEAGNLTLDSCNPGYTHVTVLSKGSCYNAGAWDMIKIAECVEYPGPDTYFEVGVYQLIGPGTQIILYVETGTELHAYVEFMQMQMQMFNQIVLSLEIYTYFVSVGHYYPVENFVDINTVIPENTQMTLRFEFTATDVGIYVDDVELTRYNMVMDPALIDNIFLFGFEKIFKITGNA